MIVAVPVILVVLLVYNHLLGMTTSVNLVHHSFLLLNYTLMIRCGMVKDVELLKVLVVTLLVFHGSIKFSHLPVMILS